MGVCRFASRATAVCLLAAGCAGGPGDGIPLLDWQDGGAADSARPNPGTAQAGIGPIALGAGVEKTVCITRQLPFTADMFVTRLTADLAPGSHHLILYKQDSAAALDAVVPCAPFSETFGVLHQKPLFIVEKAHDELDLPSGVGLRLSAGQYVTIEAHYLNATAADLVGAGSVQFYGTPVATATGMVEANLGFWGTRKIKVPPHGSFDTGPLFERGYTSSTVFALTTHTHRFGTRARVWQSPQAGQLGALLGQTLDWTTPPLYRVDPPLTFDGNSGLSFECEWSNPTDQPIAYGESALAEMCFIWLYYYPSHGFDFCIDGTCIVE